MKRLEATVYGRVQGVSFRYYTQIEAQRLGISGWVANQYDGTVKVVAEGDERALQQLLLFLHRGSPMASVERVMVAWGLATHEFPQFRIRRL